MGKYVPDMGEYVPDQFYSFLSSFPHPFMSFSSAGVQAGFNFWYHHIRLWLLVPFSVWLVWLTLCDTQLSAEDRSLTTSISKKIIFRREFFSGLQWLRKVMEAVIADDHNLVKLRTVPAWSALDHAASVIRNQQVRVPWDIKMPFLETARSSKIVFFLLFVVIVYMCSIKLTLSSTSYCI